MIHTVPWGGLSPATALLRVAHDPKNNTLAYLRIRKNVLAHGKFSSGRIVVALALAPKNIRKFAHCARKHHCGRKITHRNYSKKLLPI